MKTTPLIYYDSGKNVRINDRVYLVDMGALPWTARVIITDCGKDVDGHLTITVGRRRKGSLITRTLVMRDDEPDWYLFFADEGDAIKFIKNKIKYLKQKAIDSITVLCKTMLDEVEVDQDVFDIFGWEDASDRINIHIGYNAEDDFVISTIKTSSGYYISHAIK